MSSKIIMILGTFIRIFNCQYSDEGILMNNHFTGIGCLQGANIVHYIFAFIGIFLVLFFGLIINVIYVDTYRCKNVKAR